MATNFVSYQTFSLRAEISQDPLDRFLQSLHHTVGIEMQSAIQRFEDLANLKYSNSYSWCLQLQRYSSDDLEFSPSSSQNVYQR